MKIKCIIVDDEPLAIEVIESYVDRLENIEVVGKYSNALKAFDILKKDNIDLIFLDIQMPKLTGLDFIKTLQNPPKVIITTAYRDYALEGYELNVVDYLLKPISFERFLKAVSRVYHTDLKADTTELTNNIDSEEAYIFLKADKKMVKVHLRDILYIESLKDYVRVKTRDKEVITHQKISYLEEKLPEECFLRIHRSFIVSVKKIETYSATSIEVPGKELPIGRLYKDQVLEILNAKHQI